MKATTFEPTTYAQWEEVAIKSLRGIPFEKLITRTDEEIDLQPLYTNEQLQTPETLAIIRAAKEQGGWVVAQRQHANNATTFVSELKKSIERGNEAIVYDGTTPFEWDDESLSELANLLTSYPIFLEHTTQTDPIMAIFNLVTEENRHKVMGAISLSSGLLPDGYSNVRTLCADVRENHHKGADAVTELALAIAEAAEFATQFDSFAEFNKRFFVRFSVDTHFFMEIAKIRAFRVLWNALGTSFGESSVGHVPILSETSLRSYSKLDPYVNLLRAGNEVFSAVLGGADVVTVHPHDVLTGTTPSSIRYARNVQLVIKEETLVNKVIDPSGGSYFIETLTKELVAKAWALFVDIDRSGGYKAYVEIGKLEQRLEKRRLAHKADVSKGKKSLIGTNVYADLSTSELKAEGEIYVADRLAEPFEKLRVHFSENQPNTVLLTFGALKDFKPRADFVGSFLATGGLQTTLSPTFNSAKNATDWIAKEKPDYVILCATNQVTEEVVQEVLTNLPEGIVLDVAGKYNEELSNAWLDMGLNGFIYAGQDKIKKLMEIKNEWKGDGEK